eukprot:SAG22_NODE_1383_length_4542_cov_2.418636_1_plen_175_part_00
MQPAPAPAPAAPAGSELQCTTYPQFFAAQQAVTAACCGDAAAACDVGTPTRCTTETCAAALRPFQSACSRPPDWLTTVALADNVLAAVATCPAPPPPPLAPCSDYREFSVAVASIDGACCADAASPCVGGMPTACSRAYGEVLPPFRDACHDFLQQIGMDSNVEGALAMCGGEH